MPQYAHKPAKSDLAKQHDKLVQFILAQILTLWPVQDIYRHLFQADPHNIPYELQL